MGGDITLLFADAQKKKYKKIQERLMVFKSLWPLLLLLLFGPTRMAVFMKVVISNLV